MVGNFAPMDAGGRGFLDMNYFPMAEKCSWELFQIFKQRLKNQLGYLSFSECHHFERRDSLTSTI
jgi:hypothetical protein